MCRCGVRLSCRLSEWWFSTLPFKYSNNEAEIHNFGCFLWHSLELMSPYISDLVHTSVFSTFLLPQVVTGRCTYRTMAATLCDWAKLHRSHILVFPFTHCPKKIRNPCPKVYLIKKINLKIIIIIIKIIQFCGLLLGIPLFLSSGR